MIIIGIDPGISGAIAAIDHNGQLLELSDMPSRAIGGNGMMKRRIDGAALRARMLKIIPADEAAMCFLEDVSIVVSSGDGGSARASMMMTKGAILAILDTVPKLEVRTVVAQTWKRFFGLKKNKLLSTAGAISTDFKRQSRERAQRMFPDAGISMARHADRAEALLIAVYGRTVWQSEKSMFDPRETPVAVKANDFADIPFG